MTDLQKKLREAVAFDDVKRWWLFWNPHNKEDVRVYQVNPTWIAERDTLIEVISVPEHARLQPILAALEGCVEALEFVSKNYQGDAKLESSRVLETLRKVLEAK